jgi:hypothetical protein
MAADAAEEQAKAYGNSEAMQLAFLREVRADIADAVDQGIIDLDTGFNAAIQELRGMSKLGAISEYQKLLQDPEAIMQRPSVQYQYGQGIDAMQSAFSRTSGGGVSGSSLKAAQEYGQNFAASYLDQELSRLTPLINIETGALNNIANLQAGKGQSKANLRVSGATGSGQITQGVAQNVANTQVAAGQTAASYGATQANILNSVLSQLGLLGAYKMDSNLFKGGGGQ